MRLNFPEIGIVLVVALFSWSWQKGNNHQNFPPAAKRKNPPISNADPPAEKWQVLSVHDGDTMKVSRGGTQLRIRFACIDAPELSQPGGIESRDNLRQLIAKANNQAQLMILDNDHYGRKVAEAFLVLEDLAYV